MDTSLFLCIQSASSCLDAKGLGDHYQDFDKHDLVFLFEVADLVQNF